MLTSRSFIVLVCAFRSVTYFKLYFAYGTIEGIMDSLLFKHRLLE